MPSRVRLGLSEVSGLVECVARCALPFRLRRTRSAHPTLHTPIYCTPLSNIIPHDAFFKDLDAVAPNRMVSLFCGTNENERFNIGNSSYKKDMKEIRQNVFVALRTAPKAVRRNFASAKTALEGDAATEKLTDLVMKQLNDYDIVQRPKSKPEWPSTH